MLGHHDGIINFTVGQRRGLGVAGRAAPLYVVRIEPQAKRVVVGPKAALGVPAMTVAEINWLGDDATRGRPAGGGENPLDHAPVPAILKPLGGGRARVELQAPAEGVSPGQVAVFYQDARMLGGGWIERPDTLEAVAEAAA